MSMCGSRRGLGAATVRALTFRWLHQPFCLAPFSRWGRGTRCPETSGQLHRRRQRDHGNGRAPGHGEKGVQPCEVSDHVNGFPENYSDAQIEDEIAYVKNFGRAPQRFNSRARPYGRECRRWNIIFQAVSAEACGPNPKRRILARMFLVELGGENSIRLVLGGFLADLIGSLGQISGTPTPLQPIRGQNVFLHGYALSSPTD